MNNLKAKVKELVGEAVLRTGLWERCLRTWARRDEAIALVYHRVIEKWDRSLDYSQPGMVVTAETFDRQVAFLKKHFDIVPLSFIANSDFGIRNSDFSGFPNPASASSDVRIGNPKSQIPNSKFARPLCAITFDDGWRDNYEIAFPILRKHRVPATIFLTTDFIGTNRVFWHTELLYLLLHGQLSKLTRSHSVFQAYPAPVRHRLMRLARIRQARCAHHMDPIIEAVKRTCDEDTIEALIRDLAKGVGVSRPVFTEHRFFLDWDQVCEMAAAGVEIGSHGRSHRILTRLKTEEAKEEIVGSKAEIEHRIGQGVQHFAFPNGEANGGLLTLVVKAGYRTACLCASGPGGGQFGALALRRLGMAEAVSLRGDGSFSESTILLWLLRAPRMRLV